MLNIAFLPLPAALLGEYINHPAERQAAVLVYSGTLAVGGVLDYLLWRHAARDHRLLAPGLDPVSIRRLTRRYQLGPTLYSLAFILAFFRGSIGLALCALRAVLYFLPGFTHRD